MLVTNVWNIGPDVGHTLIHPALVYMSPTKCNDDDKDDNNVDNEDNEDDDENSNDDGNTDHEDNDIMT